MDQIFNAPVEEIVKLRTSVRSYEKKPLSQELKKQLTDYISRLACPFGPQVRFQLIETEQAAQNAKLGTYGMIRGASIYVGAAVEAGPFDLESVGYTFEKLILFAASLGLGTCWLGGTFKKGEFAKVMNLSDQELFPAISPIGYGLEKRHLIDSLTRFSAKSDQRKPWNELFYQNDFSTPLSQADCGHYAQALELVRLGPSASNKQPWRIVKEGSNYHFYKLETQGYGKKLGYDIQRLDIGIAACHFHLYAMENQLAGNFKTISPQVPHVPEQAQYIISWVSEAI